MIMPQQTDLSKEVYILPLNNLIAEKNLFEKSNTIIEKICSEHRVELNTESKKLDEIENNLIDRLVELQKNIYDFFKKHSLCINNIDQGMIEKDDFMLLFHDYCQSLLPYSDPYSYFIPLAFISDETNEKSSKNFGLLFQSYAHLNYFGYIGYEKIGSIERPEKLDVVVTRQKMMDCLSHKTIVYLNIDLHGWEHFPILFGNTIWQLTREENSLSEEEKCERLRLKHEGRQKKNKRERISEDVKIFVWRRDQGRCVKCGSQEKLEFDHIIPVSKGGSSTSRNVQLLCEPCNRSKSNNI